MKTSDQYDGNTVVVHRVQHGQSLSAIASQFGMTDWRPIWEYNSRVTRTLSGDPDKIRAGAQIYIPRSRAGYDRVTKRLHACLRDIEHMAFINREELEKLRNEWKAEEVLWNLGGSIASAGAGAAVGGLRQSAKTASQAVKTAKEARGTASFLQRWFAGKEVKSLAARLDLAGGNLTTYQRQVAGAASYVAGNSTKRFHKQAAMKVGEAALSAVNKGAGSALKAANNIRNSKGLLEAIADVSVEAADYLGYLDPYHWTQKLAGATIDDSIDDQQKMIKELSSRQASRLRKKIQEIQAEKKLVWTG